MSEQSIPDRNNLIQTPESERKADSTEYFELAADLIEKTITLSAALESERSPDISEYTFFFDGEAAHYLPEVIRDLVGTLGTLDEIQIDVSHSEGDPTSNFTIRFCFGEDNHGNLTVYSASRPGYGSDLTQSLDQYESGGGQAQNVIRIPQEELNMCVASLCFPSKDGDFSLYSGLSPNDGTIFEPLIDSLRKKVPNFFSDVRYMLDGAMPGYYSYTVDNGDVIDATVRKIVDSELSIHEDGRPVDHEVAIEMSISVANGVTLTFERCELTNGIEIRRPMHVDLDDYRSALEFLEHHKSRSLPVTPEPFQETEIIGDEEYDTY